MYNENQWLLIIKIIIISFLHIKIKIYTAFYIIFLHNFETIHKTFLIFFWTAIFFIYYIFFLKHSNTVFIILCF